jgi:hypothetical protein
VGGVAGTSPTPTRVVSLGSRSLVVGVLTPGSGWGVVTTDFAVSVTFCLVLFMIYLSGLVEIGGKGCGDLRIWGSAISTRQLHLTLDI